MNAWLIATIGLAPALAVPLVVALRANANNRLAAVQLASAIAAFMLVAMTFAFDQSSFVDLALCLVLLAVPGTLLFTVFMERWL